LRDKETDVNTDNDTMDTPSNNPAGDEAWQQAQQSPQDHQQPDPRQPHPTSQGRAAGAGDDNNSEQRLSRVEQNQLQILELLRALGVGTPARGLAQQTNLSTVDPAGTVSESPVRFNHRGGNADEQTVPLRNQAQTRVTPTVQRRLTDALSASPAIATTVAASGHSLFDGRSLPLPANLMGNVISRNDLDRWTFDLTRYSDTISRGTGTTDAEMIKLAGFFLDGSAATSEWYRRQYGTMMQEAWTYAHFLERFSELFVSRLADGEAIENYERCKRRVNEDLHAYFNRFSSALANLPPSYEGATTHDQVRRLGLGMRDHFNEVFVHAYDGGRGTPKDLNEAKNRLWEASERVYFKKGGPTTTPQRGAGQNNRGATTDAPRRSPSALNALPAAGKGGQPRTAPTTPTSAAAPLGKLSEEEREDCRQRNACFRCRQEGHLSRDCPFKADAKSRAPSATRRDSVTHTPKSQSSSRASSVTPSERRFHLAAASYGLDVDNFNDKDYDDVFRDMAVRATQQIERGRSRQARHRDDFDGDSADSEEEKGAKN
jgi:hypothetical protein